MRRILPIAIVALVPLLAGCSSRKESCSEEDRKEVVLETARSWYLYRDLLPATVSLAEYASAEQLLRALTKGAREQGLDHDGWTGISNAEAYAQYHQEGRAVGFGYAVRITGAPPAQRLLIVRVFAGSAAARAGFVRGDEILAAGADEQSLVNVADAALPAALASPGGLAGVTRVFRVLPRGQTAPVLRTMTSAEFDLDPVPSYKVFDGGTTGYLELRTFIPAAQPALRSAIAALRDAGVQDLVVDLRYNGGGDLATAELLANLLSAELAGSPMFETQFNAEHADRNALHSFTADAAAGSFRRIAFVVTGASASASELVPNVLDPYRTAATIGYAGARTYGKPVGQVVYSVKGCSMVMSIVAFRTQNAAGDAGYFDGLPDANSHAPLCPAEDDVGHEQDDPAEAMTAAARYFVEHGACPPAPPPALRALRAPLRMAPLADGEATPAAVDMPGTF